MSRGPSAFAVGIVLITVATFPAFSQGLNFMTGESDTPIEVTADNGIEWDQDGKIFTARGNANAVQGTLKVISDELRAYYRPKSGRAGGTDIWRLDAVGNVKIASPTETATGDAAVYDIDKAVMVLTGKNVRYATAQDVITADRQIEYWEGQQMAVARGNAVATRSDRRLKADVIVARFRSEKVGSKVYRVEAFDNVTIVTTTETVSAERAVYLLDTGIVTLAGAVKIVRGGNQIDGCSAEVNMRTGISKMTSCGDTSRVRGVLIPENVRKK